MKRRFGSTSEIHPESRGLGFTLVEVMIVIAIIAVLASITLTAVQGVRRTAAEAHAKSTAQAISQALENYFNDEGTYPGFGKKPDPERNDCPLLYNALFDAPKAEGGLGGRNAPYIDNFEEEDIRVEGDDGIYEVATRAERNDPKIPKYITDPWGNPFVYRCNKGMKLRDYMKNRKYDIYSLGPNEKDDTMLGLEGEENDDIGNW